MLKMTITINMCVLVPTSPFSLSASSAYPTTNTHSMMRPLNTITALRVRARVTCQKRLMNVLIWTARSAIHFTPDRLVHSGSNSASLGSSLAMLQLLREDCSHFHHRLYPATHLYSSVNWDIVERTKMPILRNGIKVDSKLGCLDCGSSIIPQTDGQTATSTMKYYVLEVTHSDSSQCTTFYNVLISNTYNWTNNRKSNGLLICDKNLVYYNRLLKHQTVCITT